MNAKDIQFRASSLGDIMSGVAKNWAVENSLTCKRKLIEIYRFHKYGRKNIFSNKYTQKGIEMEQDAATLYSRFRKAMFTVNKEIRLYNDYFQGEYDIKHGQETIDLKCSWGLSTLPHPAVDSVDKDYFYQGQAYMDLSKADRHTVAYCLVNAPARLIISAKNSLFYEMECPDETNPKFIERKIEIEQNMIFDVEQFDRDNPNFDYEFKPAITTIPIEDRVVEFSFERCDKTIAAMKARVDECREWLNENLFKNGN